LQMGKSRGLKMSKTDLLLAFRNVFRQKVRSLVILLTISISGFVLLFIGGLYNSLFDMVEGQQIAEAGHIMVIADPNMEEQALIPGFNQIRSEIEGDPMVEKVVPRREVSGLMGSDDRSALFSGEIVESDETDGVILGKVLAKSLQLQPGDDVNFLIGWNGFSLTFVKGISTESAERNRVYASIPWKVMERFDNPDSVSSIAVFLKNKENLQEYKTILEEVFRKEGLKVVISTYSDDGSYFTSVKNIYMNNYYFILGVIILTVFFAIFNTITMAIMERIREIGTLQSFGFTHHRVQGLLLVEGGFLGFCGFFISGGSAYLTQIIINSNGGLHLPPPPTVEHGITISSNIPGNSFVLTFFVIIFVSITATLISTTRVSKMDVINKLNHV